MTALVADPETVGVPHPSFFEGWDSMINGQELRLSDLGGDPADGLFFVFRDPTSKTETYPGGRFLETEPVVNERSCWTPTLQPRAQSTLRGNS